jgi:hypothetical protein
LLRYNSPRYFEYNSTINRRNLVRILRDIQANMFTFFRILAILLLLGLYDMPQNTATFWVLRIYLVIVAICATIHADKLRTAFWEWTFGIMSLALLPFIHYSQIASNIIYLISVALFAISIVVLERKEKLIAEQALERKKREELEHPARARPARETKLWERSMNKKDLAEVRTYILAELPKMEQTDWAHYVLSAITNFSPEFSKLLIGDELDLEFIKKTERNGINEAIEAVKRTDVGSAKTLREYFHNMFTNLYKTTSYAGGDKFYWYGRDRVIALLRSYQASKKKFMPSSVHFYDANGDEIILNKDIDQSMIKTIKQSIEKFRNQTRISDEEKKKKWFIPDNPYVEFDLPAIARKGYFKYNGSLINSLYIDIRASLGLCERVNYDGNWATTSRYYDLEASYFSYDTNNIMVVKYRGAVDNFQDRLYVEFIDTPEDSWLIRWLKSYKLHLEGND